MRSSWNGWIVVALAAAGCPGDDSSPTGPGGTNPTGSTGSVVETSDGPGGSDTTEGPQDTDVSTTTGFGTTEDPTTAGNDTTDGEAQCFPPGTFVLTPSGLNDPFGHLPFILLFFNQATTDATGTEELTITNAGGQLGISIAARDSGSGSGHGGVPEVTGPIDATDCSFDISGDVPFASDTGDFGVVTAQWTGIATARSASFTFSLSGGSIPSGPIEYELQATP